VVAGLGGCHGSQEAGGGARGQPATFTDELGRRVAPRRWPTTRVISLAPNVTELLFAIAAGPQVVGVDSFSDTPAAGLASVPRVGTDYEPSLETIVRLGPDLVISASSANRRESVEALDAMSIPTFVTDSRSLADVDRLLDTLGRLTGHGREASAERSRLQAGLAEVRESVRAAVAQAGRPGVLVVVWSDPLYVAGHDSFIDDLIEVAGGRNVARDSTGFARYPLEKILAEAPEVIILPAHTASASDPAESARASQALAFWKRWPTIPAVAHGRVHLVDDTPVVRPGARLVEGARILAGLIHAAPVRAGSR
jgi:iron complex transport system substrate-binding protein